VFLGTVTRSQVAVADGYVRGATVDLDVGVLFGSVAETSTRLILPIVDKM
jgi:hypothetical protein